MGFDLIAINVIHFISGYKYEKIFFCLIFFFLLDLISYLVLFLLHLMTKIIMRSLASGLNPGLKLCLFCLYSFEDMAKHSWNIPICIQASKTEL